jgi:hypothetical protein
MKLFLCLFSLLFASSCFSEQLHDFNQIKTAVTDGKLIRILIDYTKCSSAKEVVVPNNAAVFTPNAMAMTADNRIGSYILYFTMKDPRYPNKPVYQYGRYLIASDNSVKVIFSVLNAADYSTLVGDDSLDCKIDEGAKIFAK